jgi:predicted nuclease of restriction endonuclease-like RecB superfamily
LLTGDLVRARRKGGLLVPRFLDAATRARVLPLAEALVAIPPAMLGSSRDEVSAAISALSFPARDRVVGLGLAKLVEDRSEYEVAEGIDPENIRREVFLEAAAAHKALDVRGELDRERVLADVGARLGLTPEAVEKGLYADLRGSELLRAFRPIKAEELLARYDVSLSQAMLLRATRVVVRLQGEPPAGYRRVFRAARFHGLLHVVEGTEDGGYTLTLDGPFSLFESVQRYGLRLAMFLPAILACKSFELRAELLWGKAREKLTFELTNKHALGGGSAAEIGLSPELEAFCEAFTKLKSKWRVAVNERVFALPGEIACVPDLVFRRGKGKKPEEVYLEAFGFWSRDAVWRRVELLRKGFPARIILAVGKQLRVSEEVLGEEDAGELYVYRATISPRAILERLDR